MPWDWKKKYRFDSHKQPVVRADTRFSATVDVGITAPRILQVVVDNAMVPKSYYLIVAARSTFTVRENNANNFVVTVPAGNYNAVNFATLVQQLMNAGTQNAYAYVVTYLRNQAAYQITVTTPGAVAQLILPAVDGMGIHDQLGFDSGTTTTLPCTSTNTVNFQSISALHLCSNIVADEQSVLQELYGMQGAEFDSVTYHATDLEMRAQPMVRQSGSTFKFWLSDTDGNPIDLRGVHVVFSIYVFGNYDADEKAARAVPEKKEPPPPANAAVPTLPNVLLGAAPALPAATPVPAPLPVPAPAPAYSPVIAPVAAGDPPLASGDGLSTDEDWSPVAKSAAEEGGVVMG